MPMVPKRFTRGLYPPFPENGKSVQYVQTRVYAAVQYCKTREARKFPPAVFQTRHCRESRERETARLERGTVTVRQTVWTNIQTEM